MYRIKNQFLSIGVKPEGAELCSIKDAEKDLEYIWQADPAIWASHAPNLFPVIGGLKNGVFNYEAEEFAMPKHGFVRHNRNISLKDQTANSLTFELLFSQETLKTYPFKFRFEIGFHLKGKTLSIHHKVSNLDSKPLYFSLGGHPAFNAPLYDGETYEDCYLEFDQKLDLDTFILSSNGLLTQETKPVIKNDTIIGLHKDLFNKDALIFKDIPSKKVALKSKTSGTILTVEYSDFKNLGLWAKPGAPYVCIEPWLGIADNENTTGDIKTKEGIIELMPSKEFSASYAITIA
ncbi:aldose 1-epimerase family protein [Antarcticibacterium arcticum]|uniref:Aldose 1-epimerase family protein n=1 Tax=Antarcticibacterium arcticum TaxID=2585771 RepID=A0A5B8YI47_9FLAO|nr:aldose 1-epimerase family protein [Antarcticibacterium arcticum]QED37465.1 aldose 1-epimerase family protein [Antarcticibacterium arcticum]